MNKAENYIILKPISERFNKISKDITDKDIEYLIKDELRKQIASIDFKHIVQDIISDYLDSNEHDVIELFKKSLSNKFN